MKKFFGFTALFIFLWIGTGYAQSWKVYPYVPEGSLLAFPADEGRHAEESIEWWYASGHLTGEITGDRYSFMVSYFYFPSLGYDGFRIFNLSNENTGTFYNSTSPLSFNVLGDDSLNIQADVYPGHAEYFYNRLDETEHMIPFEYSLSTASGKDSLALDFISQKRPLILADSGLFKQGSSSYTYYFSITNNAVEGQIFYNSMNEPVSGTAWIDRQFGSFNPLTEEEYEWFCIQLNNGMDINVWNVFSKDGTIPEEPAYRLLAAYVDEDTQVTTDMLEIERLSYHFMPDSGACYAQKWRLTSVDLDMDLTITTLHNNSEVTLPFRFFEGATSVSGTVGGVQVSGMGFAELLHSYEKPEMELVYPAANFWNSSHPISWRLLNPDEGRPLQYSLECSIDQKESFFIIADGLSDTSFSWNEPDLAAGDSCWFRIRAYSIDSTLHHTVLSPSFSVYDPELTSIDPSDLKNEENIIKLYPNPARNLLMIDLDPDHAFQFWQIQDVLGKILAQREIGPLEHLEIDTSDLASGLYFLRVFSTDNVKVNRFMIR